MVLVTTLLYVHHRPNILNFKLLVDEKFIFNLV